MANAKKCDRCGKYYEINTARIACGATVNRYGYIIDKYDLCCECAYDLAEFFKGAKLSEPECGLLE